jgi:hypothetical protein
MVRPTDTKEARDMAREMCKRHFDHGEICFRNVPWTYDVDSDRAMIQESQDEIELFLKEKNVKYTVVGEGFPTRYLLDTGCQPKDEDVHPSDGVKKKKEREIKLKIKKTIEKKGGIYLTTMQTDFLKAFAEDSTGKETAILAKKLGKTKARGALTKSVEHYCKKRGIDEAVKDMITKKNDRYLDTVLGFVD